MLGLAVGLLGALGAVLRVVVDGAVRDRWTDELPLATFVVNVTGSLAAGLLLGARTHLGVDDAVVTALTVGLCGGYTTFSTATVEAVRMTEEVGRSRGVGYLVGSVVLCTAAVALGAAAPSLAT